MQWLFSLLFGFMRSGATPPTRAADAGAGLMVWSAIGGAVLWVVGPGRDWHITLNALELSAVLMAGGIVAFILLRMKPPDA